MSEEVIELDKQRPHCIVETWCTNCGKAAIHVVPEECIDYFDRKCTECGKITKNIEDVDVKDIAFFLSRKFNTTNDK